MDNLLIVPFEPSRATIIDPPFRQTLGAHFGLPVSRALCELESYIGREVNFWEPSNRPIFGGEPLPFPVHRSLTAVVLATHLERAGLTWHAIDPGPQDLSYWRGRFRRARALGPRTVAVSTTFITSAPWLRTLLQILRRELPDAKVLVGGYYYATSAKTFLSVDADVFCVGEGEERLPRVVRAICEGAPLHDIPGLYLRGPGGSLTYTGRAEPLVMNELPPVNWGLARRIDPPVNLASDPLEFGVETQRGCIFKCEFCTYRTLAAPSAMNPEAAADALWATAVAPLGAINLVDATGTFPHARWEAVLNRLIEKGGSPYPFWAYARVSDINDAIGALMSRAGVRLVFVGQESGSQRMLDMMRKGTRVEHTRPAVASLSKQGISAFFGFIHGFPGETDDMVRDTRDMIVSLNQDCQQEPTVLVYTMAPFVALEFASVADRDMLRGAEHYLGYESTEASARRAVEEVLKTLIVVSRVPHAPAFGYLLGFGPSSSGITAFSTSHRFEIFRWLKAVERGLAIFLERDLDGRRPDDAELRRARAAILDRYPQPLRWQSTRVKLSSAFKRRLLGRLQKEWANEPVAGVGGLTRTLFAATAFLDTACWENVCYALRHGTYADPSPPGRGEAVEGSDQVLRFADELVRDARQRPATDPSWKASWKRQALGRAPRADEASGRVDAHHTSTR